MRSEDKKAQDMRTLCHECVRICLAGKMADSIELVCDAVQDRLLAQGLLPGEREDIRACFIELLLTACLNQANAIYGYPYTDRDLCVTVLPVWLALLARLERPCALRDAFMSYYASQFRFPLPGQILGLLPSNAIAKRRDELFEAHEGTRTPGFGKKVCEEIRHKCQVLKFRSLKDSRQCELPVIEAAEGE